MVHRSFAEVELLSRLAELLMPGEPVGELFRDFPVEPSDSWGSRWLCPDITALGVLKDEDAALFLEYDGYPRHYEEQGLEADQRKTEALLEYAPPGSCILRVGHSARDLRRTRNSKQVVVDTWFAGHERSLMHVVRQVAHALLGNWGDVLRKDVCEHLCTFVETEASSGLDQARKFASEAVPTSDIDTRKASVMTFLEQELKLSKKGVQALALKSSRIWGVSIEGKLKPLATWFAEVGLSRPQVAKVFAGFPRLLGCSIDGNLKPTVAWLEDVGLSRQQVAKVVAGCHQVLGYSIDGNLKPTVAWLVDVGLSREQVAKVVGGFPQVLSYSIDGNLKPTVAWLEDVGLSRQQVAKAVSVKPQVFGYSIENNLSQKHFLLQQFYSQEQICSMIAYHPPMLGYRYARLFIRLKVLQEYGCLCKLARVMALTDAKFTRRFPCTVSKHCASEITSWQPSVTQTIQRCALLMIIRSHPPAELGLRLLSYAALRLFGHAVLLCREIGTPTNDHEETACPDRACVDIIAARVLVSRSPDWAWVGLLTLGAGTSSVNQKSAELQTRPLLKKWGFACEGVGLEGFGLEVFSFAVPCLPGCSTTAREKRRVIRVQSRALSKRSESASAARASIKQGGVEPFARCFEMCFEEGNFHGATPRPQRPKLVPVSPVRCSAKG